MWNYTHTFALVDSSIGDVEAIQINESPYLYVTDRVTNSLYEMLFPKEWC